MENKGKRSRGASFFKVLDGDFSNHLQMPLAFTMNLDGKIPHWLFIEIAETRKCWRVDVEHDENGGLNLTNGWDNFVKEHTLEAGNAMVFEYKGQLMLKVTIYDEDGSEKSTVPTSELKEVKAESEDSEKQSETLSLNRSHNAEETKRLTRRACERCENQLEEVCRIKRKTTAEVLITDKGVSFTVTCGDSKNLHYYQTIPKEVATKKKLSTKKGVVLKDQEGNFWLIELKTRTNGRVDLTEGWTRFLNEKQIAAGDILTFEFVTDILIQVRVVRASCTNHLSQGVEHCRNEANESLNLACKPSENSADKNKATEASGSMERVRSEFRTSSFSTTWTLNKKHSSLYIPRKVDREQHLCDGNTVILCDEEENEWPLQVNACSDNRTVLRGWTEFWRSKKLVAGDILNFEFISEDMLKVNIDRASRVNHHDEEDDDDCAVEWIAVKQEVLESGD